MSVTRVRRRLLSLTADEWVEVLRGNPTFAVFAGAPRDRHAAVRAWVSSPKRSNATLIHATEHYVEALLETIAPHPPGDDTKRSEPAGHEEAPAFDLSPAYLNEVLPRVVARFGRGPAKVVLALLSDADRDAALDLDDAVRLEALIAATEPYAEVNDQDSSEPARQPPAAPVDDGPDSGDVEDAHGGPPPYAAQPSTDPTADLERMRDRLRRWREAGRALAQPLQAAAHAVEAGALPDPALPARCQQYLDEFTQLAQDVAASFGGAAAPDPDALASRLDRLLHDLQEEQQRIATTQANLAALRAGVAAIDEMLGHTTDVTRASLADARDKSLAEIIRLGATLGESFMARERPANAPAPGIATTPEPDPARVDESESIDEPAANALTTSAEPDVPQRGAELVDSQAGDTESEPPVVSTVLPPLARATGQERFPVRVTSAPEPSAPSIATTTAATTTGSGPAPSRDGAGAITQVRPDGDTRNGWAEPQQPAMAELIRQGRGGAAWCLQACHEPDGLPAQALRYFAASFASGPDGLPAGDILVLGTQIEAEQVADNDQDTLALLMAAAIRADLAIGWGSTQSHLRPLLSRLHEPDPWPELLGTAFDAIQHGYVHSPHAGGAAAPARDSYGARADELRTELGSSKVTYQRATRILQYLLRRDQLLGQALDAVQRWAGGDDSAQETLVQLYSRLVLKGGVMHLIEAANAALPFTGRAPKIVAAAKHQLTSRIEQVVDLVSEVLAHQKTDQRGVNRGDYGATLHRLASRAQVGSGESGTVGEAALARLRDWLLDPQFQTHERAGSLPQFSETVALPLYDLRRTEDGQPDFAVKPIDLDRAAALLLDPPPAPVLCRAYAERGDLATAQKVAEQSGDQGLAQAVDDARADWRDRLRHQSRSVEALLDKTRGQGVVDEETVTRFEAVLHDTKGYDGDRMDRAMAWIDDVAEQLRIAQRLDIDQLRERVEQLPLDRETKARIDRLLDVADLMSAKELFALVESGQKLPDQDEPDADLFAEFATAARQIDDADTTVLQVAARLSDSDHLSTRAEAGLEAWDSLNAINATIRLEDRVRRVLPLLGLDLNRGAPFLDVTPRGRGGFRRYECRATPIDGSLVPGLGSQTRHYLLTLLTERRSPPLVLQQIPDELAHEPNLVLCPWSLTDKERHSLRKLCADRAVTAIVVDSADVGFLAARAPGSFKALQTVTLPYSILDHYTPYMAGDVPSEVFVGRREEMRQIQASTGSLFVYGGRQLGKSALLRRVAREFNAVAGQVAVYVDLKARGIGEFEDPAHLWKVLLEELQHHEVIGARFSSGKPENVVRLVKDWLDAEESRRILLLLDEADLFLENEARERRVGSRVTRFPNLLPLKDLMDSTGRRFKPVFAGLHQVQRFQNISNTPLAHGGRDILVGPLNPSAAMELVERPLAALGFRFADPDLVWRLLAFTNYQASLIQIVCDLLVKEMRARVLMPDQPPVLITSEDLDRVLNDRAVRQLLAERFNLTINLDSRYQVIALVLAVLSLDDGFIVRYTPEDLLEFCRASWPAGFDDLRSKEFAVYLHEMQGLGVLVVDQEGLVAFRSPNVVSMLGTKASLEQQLAEGAARYELPQDYNPRATRRVVRVGVRDVRSPLNEEDLAALVPAVPTRHPCVSIVLGSDATGLVDAFDVLVSVAGERFREVERVDWARLAQDRQRLQDRGRSGGRSLLLVDATGATAGDVEAMLLMVERHRGARSQDVVVLVGPVGAGASLPPDETARLVLLRRWNSEALRAWADQPFTGPDERRRLIEVTGGWHDLVEDAVRRVNAGEPKERVLAALQDYPRDLTQARRFLDRGGAGADLELIDFWSSFTEPAEPVEVADVEWLVREQRPDASADQIRHGIERLIRLQLVDQDAGLVSLERVIHRAARRVEEH